MRIGILTFHYALNYGAVLQAYATQSLLKRMGHDVEIINYENYKIKSSYEKKVEFSPNPKNTIVSIIVVAFNTIRKRQFKYFIEKYLHLSENVNGANDRILSIYDTILVGSDQVWNPNLTGGFDKLYWGEFNYKGKIVAWSASAKENAFTKKDEKSLISCLKNFDAISVREKVIKEFLQNKVDKQICVTLDPTLLLSRNDWSKLTHPVNERNYVLVYAMQDESLVEHMGSALAKKLNKNLLVLNANINAKIKKGYKQCANPLDFISYIAHADYVVSASFHGTAFSLLFEKQFFCFIRKGQTNMRIESLLKTVHLENRIITEDYDFMSISYINYTDIPALLEKEKSLTLSFLRNNLYKNE